MSGLAFGVVGPGAIADVFAAAIVEAGVGHVAAVVGRSPARTAAFAERYGATALDGLEALLDHRACDALYVATPHPLHADVVRAALRRRVPVLCEKPLTTDPAATSDLLALAAERGVALMEAWMYRAHPQVHELFRRLERGDLGRVRRIEAEFAFEAPYDPGHRLFAPELGGGAILDVGGYPLSFALGAARAALSTADARRPLEARLVGTSGELAPTGVDVEAHCTLDLDGVRAELRVATRRPGLGGSVLSAARVEGTRGALVLEEPWMPGGRRRGRVGVLRVEGPSGAERIELAAEHDCFALEAAAFARQIVAGRTGPAWPLVDHEESRRIAELAAEWCAHLRSNLAAPTPAD